jgi:hypothetical protein
MPGRPFDHRTRVRHPLPGASLPRFNASSSRCVVLNDLIDLLTCQLAYLVGLPPSEVPSVEIARGDLVEVVPASYGVLSRAFHFWSGPGRKDGEGMNLYENVRLLSPRHYFQPKNSFSRSTLTLSSLTCAGRRGHAGQGRDRADRDHL